MPKVITLLALTAGLSTALAQTDGAQAPKPAFKFEVTGLSLGAQVTGFPSGLQVLSSVSEGLPAVVTEIVVDAGWRYNPADAPGAADLFERAWWQSEVSPGVRVVDAFVNGYGCEVDSYVDADLLRLQSVCPPATVDAAMRLWSRLFTDPLAGVTDELLVAETARMQADATARYKYSAVQILPLSRPLMGALFPEGHPYHNAATAGSAAITKARLTAWANERVKVKGATITLLGGFSAEHPLHGPALVAGNFEPKLLDVKLTPDQIARWPYGDGDEVDKTDPSQSWGWPQNPDDPTKAMEQGKGRISLLKGTPAPEPPLPTSPFLSKVTGGVDEPTVVVGWALPGGWRKDEAVQAVLARVVAATVAEHLVEPSMDRFAGCYVVTEVDGDVLACALMLKPGQESAAERVAGRVMDQISFLVDPANRPNVDAAASLGRLRVMNDVITEMDRLDGVVGTRGFWMGSGAQLMGDPAFWSKRITEVSGSTSQAVVDLATKFITRPRFRAVAFVPDNKPGSIPFVDRIDIKDRDALDARTPYWSRVATRNAPAALPAAKIDAARIKGAFAGISSDEVATKVLSNGMRVVVLPNENSPILEARVVLGMGMVSDPTPHLDHSWARGFIVLNREQGTEIAAGWHAWRTETNQLIAVQATAAALDPVLWMLRDGVSDQVVSAKDKIAFTATWRKQLTADFYDVYDHVQRGMRSHLWGSSPIARRPTWDDFVAWEGVSTDAIKDMMRALWRPDNTTLVLSGGISAEAALASVDTYFGTWNTPAPTSTAYNGITFETAPMPSAPSVQVYNEARGGTAEVFLGCRVAGGHEAGAVAAELFRQSLGAAFSESDAIVDAYAGGNTDVILRGRVSEDKSGAGIKALLDRLAAAAAGKVSEDEIKAAVLRGAAAEGIEFTSAVGKARHVTELLAEGRTIEDELAGPDRYAKLDAAAVKAALSVCAAAPYVAVIGDGAKVDASLTAAGVAHGTVDWLAAGKAAHQKADPKGYEKTLK